ncbi:FAD-dependent oxidoreductase [Donghicola sp.]|jgi:3-phenylpropionate/trans-cinnamate dioxygenase ferredoxin reductase subunit|uniref:NAD(P)/FAD-dependent oxidoreductase n=1 Tax=Donghicola sp. TaxID=1929294 RepID=UPI0025E67427|nr:FAD-dependent oxidoreductase [Donghicola sp.]MCT4579003.1 FAD-dependent oxidoreductase [Donghicola sp.]
MSHIAVIGAGQAAASLIAELRKRGFDGDITLFGAEPVLPYQRPPLSKAYLLGEMPLERLYLRPEQWYIDNEVTLRLGTHVDAIDVSGKTLTVEDEHIAWDQLVLTTGSSPRHLPAAIGGDLEGVYVVRNLADVDAMGPEATEGKRVLIVGGGYIGLEAAAVCAKRKMDVTLIEAAPRILGRVASPETADYFRNLHQSNGVKIHEGLGLARLNGTDGRVTSAELADGATLDVDLVIVGVGITPTTGLAEAAGIALDNGIAVDEQGRTSAPDIWAAGDCASFPHGEGRMRLESVPNAIDQAECVARNILGGTETYLPKPWFWSDQYDTKLQIAGLNTGYDRIITRESGDGAMSFWYYAADTLLAVDAMNDAKAFMVAKRLIEAGRSPSAEAVADPSTNLKALLK